MNNQQSYMAMPYHVQGVSRALTATAPVIFVVIYFFIIVALARHILFLGFSA